MYVSAKRWQFNLRTMFVVFLVAAIYFWLAANISFGIWVPLSLLLYWGIGFVILSRRHYFVEALIGTGFLIVIVSLLSPIVGSKRGPGGTAHRLNNLRNVGIALIQYDAKHGHLPPPYTTDENGKPLHSWRTLILPELERNDIYKQIRFDEPWDSPHNQQFHKISIPVLEPVGPSQDKCIVFAIVGTGTAWDPAKKTSLQEIEDGDGTANTLLLIEAHSTGIHWMEPSDLQLDQLNTIKILPKGFGSKFQSQQEAVVIYADSHTGILTTKEVTVHNLKALFSINGKEQGKVNED